MVGEPGGRSRFGDTGITLLRLRALLARARGDDVAYADLVIAIARWRNRLATKGTSTGPRR